MDSCSMFNLYRKRKGGDSFSKKKSKYKHLNNVYILCRTCYIYLYTKEKDGEQWYIINF